MKQPIIGTNGWLMSTRSKALGSCTADDETERASHQARELQTYPLMIQSRVLFRRRQRRGEVLLFQFWPPEKCSVRPPYAALRSCKSSAARKSNPYSPLQHGSHNPFSYHGRGGASEDWRGPKRNSVPPNSPFYNSDLLRCAADLEADEERQREKAKTSVDGEKQDASRYTHYHWSKAL